MSIYVLGFITGDGEWHEVCQVDARNATSPVTRIVSVVDELTTDLIVRWNVEHYPTAASPRMIAANLGAMGTYRQLDGHPEPTYETDTGPQAMDKAHAITAANKYLTGTGFIVDVDEGWRNDLQGLWILFTQDPTKRGSIEGGTDVVVRDDGAVYEIPSLQDRPEWDGVDLEPLDDDLELLGGELPHSYYTGRVLRVTDWRNGHALIFLGDPDEAAGLPDGDYAGDSPKFCGSVLVRDGRIVALSS